MHDADETELWQHWHAAAGEPVIDAALRRMFVQLDEFIAAQNPTCWISGKCCRFDSYGHRLYVTGLEIAWLVRQIDDGQRARLDAGELPGMDGCPFQVNGLCGVHAIRPLGCRTFFCDPAAQHWQSEVYEAFLADLRYLHEAHGLPYRYLEWRGGLAAVRQAVPARR